MTKITDLFTLHELNRNISEGWIREQSHPEFPELRILNYTEVAQYSKMWNNVTKMCRGLIYNAKTLELLARPFQKIHNWDEPEAPRITWDAPLYDWSNKEDGSLGILYTRPDGDRAIATRGSFASEQAIHATKWLDENYWIQDEDMVNEGYTQLFEIVYPENRIVLDYGDRNELIPIGYVHMKTGAYVPAEGHESRNFDQLRMDLNRGLEGWVAWLSPYKAVKIKEAQYVEMHRLVTGLNKKSIWRAIGDGTYDSMVEAIPDELFQWAKDAARDIWDDFDNLKRQAYYWLTEIDPAVEMKQRDFALNVVNRVPRMLQGLVFSLRSGKPIENQILKMIEPKGNDR